MSFNRTLTFVFMAVAVACSTALWADPPSMVGRINFIDGQVSFRPAGLDDWAPATLNYPLKSGDQIWTDETSQAEIHIGASAIRLAPATDLAILELDDQSVQLQLSDGELNIRLRGLDAGDSFEVAMPSASVTLVEPGSYKLDVEDDGTSDVIVRSGKANLASTASSVPVFPGQEVTVTDADASDFEIGAAPPPDDWDRWCAVRDRREDRLESSRYVSDSMIGYEDLDEYGAWEPVAGYGIGWAPRHLPPGWAPYRFGHWAWVDPWGWTWIDDAQWGFAPFHYGRWTFVAGAWVWLPGPRVARPVYAPALVVFIGGAERGPLVAGGEGVGWCPLAPHEVYVPPYRVSATYIQRINIDIGANIRVDIDITRVRYANRSVPGAVTVVPRQAFVRAEHVSRAAVPSAHTEFERMPVTGMAPQLVPRRESVLARPEEPTGRVARPPAELGRRPVLVRREPPPAPMSFEERQRQMQARPGRPLDVPLDVERSRKEGDGRPGFRVLGGPRVSQPDGRPHPEAQPPATQPRPQSPRAQSPEQDLLRPPDTGPATQGPPRVPGPGQSTVRGQTQGPQPPAGGPTVERPPRGERPPGDAGPASEKRKVRKFVDGHWVEPDQGDSGGGRRGN